MSPATLDPLRPQGPGGVRTGALLAAAVHAGLLVALALSVRWRSQAPATVSAELWAAVPVSAAAKPQAAPELVEREEPLPPRTTAPPPPPPKVVEDDIRAREADIALKKAREVEKQEKAEKERAEREKAEKKKLEEKEKERERARQKEKAEREKEKADKEKADRERQERKKAQERDRELARERQAERLREETLKRMQGMAGATGAPEATGTATQAAAPSAGYAGRIVARIKPRIVFTEELSANPRAVVVLRVAPDGTILGRKLKTPSGNPAWDDAVLRAIDRTEVLPRDVDGRVPPEIEIGFSLRE